MRMLRLLLLVPALVLAGCIEDDLKKLPPDMSVFTVSAELVACANQYGVKLKPGPMTVAEVERAWKTDRLTIIALRGCFKRLIDRDNRLARLPPRRDRARP